MLSTMPVLPLSVQNRLNGNAVIRGPPSSLSRLALWLAEGASIRARFGLRRTSLSSAACGQSRGRASNRERLTRCGPTGASRHWDPASFLYSMYPTARDDSLNTVYSRLRSCTSWEDKITEGSRSERTFPVRFGGLHLPVSCPLVLSVLSLRKVARLALPPPAYHVQATIRKNRLHHPLAVTMGPWRELEKRHSSVAQFAAARMHCCVALRVVLYALYGRIRVSLEA